jgi:hypothetical protein
MNRFNKFARARTTRHQHQAGKMNGMEEQYGYNLERRKQIGEVLEYRFEPLKIRLADNTYYTIDFMLIMADMTIELHEVKGFWEDDARVKFKCAAEALPYFKFVAVTIDRKTKAYKYEELR